MTSIVRASDKNEDAEFAKASSDSNYKISCYALTIDGKIIDTTVRAEKSNDKELHPFDGYAICVRRVVYKLKFLHEYCGSSHQ